MKKVLKNLASGVLGQVISIALGLIIPRLVLVSFGSDINGLLNSTSNLFAYIALLEGGVATATLQALYGPVSRKEHDNINSILAAMDHFYRRTGVVYLLCIVVFALGYPLVVNTDISPVTVALVVLLQGLSGVLVYFFQGKFRSLLQAEGKNYILTNLATVVQVLVGFGKAIVILLGYNVVVVQMVYFAINVGQMAFIMLYIKKKYRWINLKVKPNFNSISQKYDVLITHISSLVFNNTDTILLSMFCNLKTVSVYSIYLMLCNMINAVVDTISSSITFQFGFWYNNNIKKFIRYQKIFERYYLALVFWLYSVLLVFILPFIKLYTKGVTDADYLNTLFPWFFVIMQLLSYSKRPYNQVIILSQKFKETKWRAVTEAIINLVISIIAVRPLGVYGVLFGSIVALAYRVIDMVIYTNRLLKTSVWGSVANLLTNTCIFLTAYFLFHSFVGEYADYFSMMGAAALVTVISGVMFLGINSLLHIEDVRLVFTSLKRLVEKRSQSE